MAKNYPLFLIDRNQTSKKEAHKSDYVTCLCRAQGFVARVYILSGEMYRNLNPELFVHPHYLSNGNVVVMEVLEFLHPFEMTDEARKNVYRRLKQGMGKYLYAEAEMVSPLKEVDGRTQVAVLTEVVANLKRNYRRLETQLGEHRAKVYKAAVERSIVEIESLHGLKR